MIIADAQANYLAATMSPKMENFVFLIPVKPRAISSDWDMVTSNLRSTLASILASNEPGFRVLIASHDDIDLPQDSRLNILKVKFDYLNEIKSGIKDKQNKLRFLGSILRNELYSGYIMYLDADDLISRKLVEYVLSDNNKRSYLVRCGYRFDVTTGNLKYQPSGFDKSCGSCFIGYFESSDLPISYSDKINYFSKFLRHTVCFEEASAYGRVPEDVPFPAVVYVINHSDSLRMARLDGYVRFVSNKDKIPNAREILLEEFGFHLKI